MQRAAVISLCHGGGPLPLLNDPGHKSIIASMQTRVPSVLGIDTPQQPKAILLVTAHWETKYVTISNGAKHDMLYDYGGFPRESYSIKHNAPGHPEVAALVSKTLSEAGIQSEMDSTRGWDHGVFVPMKLIDPSAKIPIVQMSVLASQSPKDLFALGEALSSLREENIAVIGSGSASYHNLRALFSGSAFTDSADKDRKVWAKSMDDAMAIEDADKRRKEVENWRNWPHANDMHPPRGAEHFSPMIVCAGAAGKATAESWTDDMMGMAMRSYYWK